jgi:hypothetical protein
MDANIVYCSACDRNVRVIPTTPAADAGAGQSYTPVGVCLEYCADACTGSMCAVYQVPTTEMRRRLRDEGHELNC